MQGYSQAVADEVIKCLIRYKIKHIFNRKEGTITFRFEDAATKKIGTIKSDIHLFGDGYAVYGTLGIQANRNNPIEMSAISDYINFVNNGIYEGTIEFDQRNGTIRAKAYVPCQNIKPSADMIVRSLYIPSVLFRQFGGGFSDIIWNKATAVECARKYKKIDIDDRMTESKKELLSLDVDVFRKRLSARFGILSEDSNPEGENVEEETVILKRKLFED